MNPRYAPRPEILEQLQGHNHAVVEASAGTGKTFTLENLVVDLILRDGIPLEKILIVTFTEKATAELKLRLRSKLRRLIDGQDSQSSAPENGPAWRIGNAASERLSNALVSFDRTTIATIHAFCQRILLEHAFSHRRPFKQTLIDGRAAFDRAFLNVLRTELACDPLPKMWLESWLEHSSLDALRQLTFECLERQGQLSPEFDPKRLRKAIYELSRTPTHPRAIKPLLIQAKLRGATLRKTVGRLERIIRLIKLGPDKLPAFIQALEQEEPHLLEELLLTLKPAVQYQPHLSRLTDGLDALEKAVCPFKSAAVQVFLPRILNRLRAEKAEKGELDFGDMLRLFDESLQSEAGHHLAAQLRERYPVAIIDEFQDTDVTQWRIFRRIYLETSESKSSHRLVVIGDPKQAIYGFRGADVGTYLRARDELIRAGGRRIALSKSFRAIPPLVDAMNELLDQSVTPPFFPGQINYKEPVSAGRSNDTRLEEDGKTGPPAILLQLELEEGTPHTIGRVERCLAASIAHEVAQLLNRDPAKHVIFHSNENDVRTLNPSDIFVLTRSGREGALMTAALLERGIPAAVYKQEGLFQSSEAHDILSVLAAVADPHRKSLALRAWGTPFFNIPMERWVDCQDLTPSNPLVARLLTWKAYAERRAYPRLFTSILEDSRVMERLLLTDSDDRAITNYLHIFEILNAEAADGRPPLRELVHRLQGWIENNHSAGTNSNIERLESDRNAVQVMTMHKAKGLEAEVVFLFGGLRTIPSSIHPYHEDHERMLFVGNSPPAVAEDEAEDEARRLLYVALTRARTRLYIPYLSPLEIEGLGGTQAIIEPHLTRVAQASHHWTVQRVTTEPLKPPPASPPSPEFAQAFSAHMFEKPSIESTRKLRVERVGPVITSYSRMKADKESSSDAKSNLLDDRIEERAFPAPSIAENQLPSGAASGRFLHEVIEEVDFRVIRSVPDFDVWFARSEVKDLIDRTLTRHRRSTAYRLHGAQLVWSALRTPLSLGLGHILEGGLCCADRVVREMEFLYPFPSDAGKGFIKGFIDIVFEHRGRMYVLDWKSDNLPDYTQSTLDPYVQENYLLQAEIYTIAVTRLLGIASEAEYDARFGSSLYVFIRGLVQDHSDIAQWIYRPSWNELIEASARLDPKKTHQR